MMSDEYGEVSTGIKLSKSNIVTICRSGAYKSKFTLEKGKRCNTLYSTPFGNITMGFYGEEIKSTLNETGGKLELKYTVDVNKSQVNRNEIYVTVREM